MTDRAIISLLHLCCRYGGQPRLLWVWELQHNEGYRSMFTIVIVASKNSRTTVSPSTGTHYMKMHGWAWCSNMSARPFQTWHSGNQCRVSDWPILTASFIKKAMWPWWNRVFPVLFQHCAGRWLFFWPYSGVMCMKGTGLFSNFRPHICNRCRRRIESEKQLREMSKIKHGAVRKNQSLHNGSQEGPLIW